MPTTTLPQPPFSEQEASRLARVLYGLQVLVFPEANRKDYDEP